MSGSRSSPLNNHAHCCQLPGSTYSDNSCRVRFPRNQSWVLLSGTCYQKAHRFTGRLADVMAAGNPVGGTLHVASVELKSGGFAVPEVRDQLQNAADVLDQDLPRGNVDAKFVAVLMHAGVRRSNLVRKELADGRNRVRFRGRAFRIGLVRCGSELGVQTWTPLAS